MKKIILILFTLSSSLLTFSQTWLWGKQGRGVAGQSYYTQGNVVAVSEDGNNNVFGAGNFEDTITFAPYKLVTAFIEPNNDVFLVKYDLNGNVLWAKQASIAIGSASADATDVAADVYGNVYMIGYLRGSIAFGKDTLTSRNRGSDFFLVKYDASGGVIWAKEAKQDTNGYASGVATDPKGNVYVTGYFQDSIVFDAYTLKATGGSKGNVFITKYDTGGNVIWARQSQKLSNAQNWTSGSSITVYDTNIYVAGCFADTCVFQKDTLFSKNAWGDFFLVKYDTGGRTVDWVRQSEIKSPIVYGAGNVEFCGVIADASGNVYITSSFADTVVFGSYKFTSVIGLNGGYITPFLVKYNPNGTILWARASILLPNYTNWFGNSLTTDAYRHVYWGGAGLTTANYSYKIVFSPDTLSISIPENANPDFFIELDSLGNVLCTSIIPPALGGAWPESMLTSDPTGNDIYLGSALGQNYVFGKDTLTYTHNIYGTYAYPFIAKWKSCITNPMELSAQADSVCSNSCNGVATAFPFGGSPPYTYLWSNGATTRQDSNLCPGTYIVVVSDSTGKKDTVHVSVVNAPLSLQLSPALDSICKGDSVFLKASGATNYQWSTGSTHNTIWVKPDSSTRYILYGFSGSCADSAVAAIHVIPRISASFSVSKDTICSPDTAMLTATGKGGQVAYKWSNGATTSSIQVNPSGTTVYTVTVYGICDSVQKTFTLTVLPAPLASISGTTTKCSGLEDTLIASGGGFYLWSNGSTNATYYMGPINSDSTVYVTVKDADGCATTASFTVKPYSPDLSVCCNATIIMGNDTILVAKGSGIVKYRWLDSNGIICLNPPLCDSVKVSPTVTTTYTIIGTDSMGCPTERVITIVVETPCFNLVVPNVFTPTNAGMLGVDNLFYIMATNISAWSIVIYDRWGVEMYKSINPNVYWDGNTESGGQAPAGVYYYIINGTCQGNIYKKDGFVQLIR